jgi:hypothetical protein
MRMIWTTGLVMLVIAAGAAAGAAQDTAATRAGAGEFNADTGQPATMPAATRPTGRDAPVFTSPPAVYSGISGAGKPVTGSGLGGWRSGREGVRYKGADPKSGWQLDWDAKGSSSDRVIDQGLLPPIKPLLELHLRDTIIRVGGDGMYYMTGSTGDNIWDKNDGVELYRSADLQHWKYLGLVWSVERDGTWEKNFRYVWAPEIHFIGNNYYISYCMNGGSGGGTGVLRSTTGRPEGPYANAARLTSGIDATLFEDDDGKVYFTWGRGGTIYRMNEEMTGFADEGVKVQIDPDSLARAAAAGVTGGVAFEGASLFKRDGRYYLSGAFFVGGIDRATGRNGRYSSAVMIADHIYGPYRLWHEAVPCGGGGNYFKDKLGRWWCTCFGNDEASPFREKPAIVQINFNPDGTIKIADEQPAFVLRAGAAIRWRKPAN